MGDAGLTGRFGREPHRCSGNVRHAARWGMTRRRLMGGHIGVLVVRAVEKKVLVRG